MAFDANSDICLELWRQAFERMPIVFPPDATVLEIGCAEADWMTPMLAERPDLKIHGIDWRACETDRPGLVYRADVLTAEFPENSFDAVVGISSLEHVGLGHYDDDPLDVDGDTHCMARVVRWLKPGGFVYADVPFGAQYEVCGTSHRVYDEAAVRARLLVPGLILKAQAYHLPEDGGMSYTMILAEKHA